VSPGVTWGLGPESGQRLSGSHFGALGTRSRGLFSFACTPVIPRSDSIGKHSKSDLSKNPTISTAWIYLAPSDQQRPGLRLPPVREVTDPYGFLIGAIGAWPISAD